MPSRYPFWKDTQLAYTGEAANRYREELKELKGKIKNIKCPNCGHVFDSTKEPGEKIPIPVCTCLKCGSKFTIRHQNQETVSSYAQRLQRITCFNCGAESGYLKIID